MRLFLFLLLLCGCPQEKAQTKRPKPPVPQNVIPVDVVAVPSVPLERMRSKYKLAGAGSDHLLIDEQSAAKLLRAMSEKLLAPPPPGYDEHRSKLKLNYFHHVYAMLPDYAPKTDRHVGYYADLQRTAKAEQLAYVVRYADRSAKSVQLLYEFLAPHLDAFLPLERYERSGAKETVRALIATHDALFKKTGYELELEALYKKSRALERAPVPPGAYGRSEAFFSMYEPYWGLSETLGTQISSVWLVSFWARRQGEGNRGAVLDILRKLEARAGP